MVLIIFTDAANFNSWRRHLKLSGSPTENIAYAWEDVKAMFNGGTRKRLVSSPMSQSHASHGSKSDTQRRAKDTTSLNSQYSSRPSQQPIQHQQHTNVNPASDSLSTTQPLNEAITPLKSSPSTSAPFHQDLPFSLSHYVWHYQQQTQAISLNTPANANKGSNFQFPALNWIKQQPSTLPTSFLFKPNGTSIAPINPLSKDEKPPSTFNHFHSAAFKPVINMRLTNDESNVSISTLNHNTSPTSSTNQSDDERLTPAKKFLDHIKYVKEKESDINANNNMVHEELKPYEQQSNDYESKANSQSDDENEMVDIESTEDDVNILNLHSFHTKHSDKDDEEEIEVDEKVDNNNSASYKMKNTANSLTDITSNIEMQENYFAKKHCVNFANSNDKEWQQKKEVSGEI